MATSQIVTADELMRLSSDGCRYELMQGELHTMSPTGDEHGIVTMALGIRLGSFVLQHKLGAVFAAETGFHLEHDPDTVLAPALAFIGGQRVAATGLSGKFWQGAVLSETDILSGGELVPGFACRVGEIFPPECFQ